MASAANAAASGASAASAAADANRALEAALKENAKLKKRLAKLQRIESGLDAKDESSAAAAKQRETQRDVCKKAFDDFDLDKSGYIEINELALLATELNAPMSQSELEAANKAIDISGDGKISFDEFFRYWNSGAAPAGPNDKNPIQLALLRARLLSHKSKKILEAMASEAKKGSAASGKSSAVASASTATASATSSGAAALSTDAKASPAVDHKANPFDEAVPAGARVHSYHMSVGDYESGAAKAKVNFGFKNGLIADPAILAADPKFGTFVSLDIRTTGKPDFVPYLQNVARSFSRSLGEYVTFSVCSPGKDVARVTVGVAVPIPDPSELLSSLGIDPAVLARVLTVRLEFMHTLTDLVDPKQALSPLDFLHFRVDSRMVLEDSVVKALGTALALAPGGKNAKKAGGLAPYLGLWDSRVSMQFGDFKALLGEVLAGSAPGQLPIPKPLAAMVKTPLVQVAEKKLREQLERDRRGELKAGISGFRIILLTFARDFAEIMGVSAWTRAGLGVQLSLDGMLDFGRMLEAINWVDGIANPQPTK